MEGICAVGDDPSRGEVNRVLDCLRGEPVTLIRIDGSATLFFHRAGEVRISPPLDLTDGHGVRPWSGPRAAEVSGALVDLMWAEVDDVTVEESTGALSIRFTDGRRIDVRADDDHEAWSYDGPGGRRVACLSGGRLDVRDAGELPAS